MFGHIISSRLKHGKTFAIKSRHSKTTSVDVLYHDIDELVICLGDDSSCRDDSAADESGNETFLGIFGNR